jgi:hypothetical protein
MSNISPLYMRALDLARAAINVVSFASGQGISASLDIAIGENGIPTTVIPQDPSIASLCTAYRLSPSNTDFHTIYNIVLGEPALSLVLNDLTSAVRLPHVSPVACARAMEGLKHLIAAPGSKDAAAWRQMQEKLRIDQRYLQFITGHSKGPRHARPEHVPGNITTEVTRRSWVVMDRYFEYRKRGGQQPLPLSEFSLLTA